jgi:hypothetical protein
MSTTTSSGSAAIAETVSYANAPAKPSLSVGRFGQLPDEAAGVLSRLSVDLQKLTTLVPEGIYHLADVDDQFWRYVAIQRDNERLHGAPIFSWMADAYLTTMVIGVRRLVDRTKGVRSLYKVLEELKKVGGHLTAQWWASRYRWTGICWATEPSAYVEARLEQQERDEHATRYVGLTARGQGDMVTAARVQMDRLTNATKYVQTLTNQHYAHHSKMAPVDPKTWSHIREAFAEICVAADWCYQVVDGTGLGVQNMDNDDVYAGLDVAWLPGDTVVPKHERLGDILARLRSAT